MPTFDEKVAAECERVDQHLVHSTLRPGRRGALRKMVNRLMLPSVVGPMTGDQRRWMAAALEAAYEEGNQHGRS